MDGCKPHILISERPYLGFENADGEFPNGSTLHVFTLDTDSRRLPAQPQPMVATQKASYFETEFNPFFCWQQATAVSLSLGSRICRMLQKLNIMGNMCSIINIVHR